MIIQKLSRATFCDLPDFHDDKGIFLYSMGIFTTEQAAWLSLSVNIDHQKLETTAKGPV
jgi:hypothetical protein